jgi:undecaprenyl diphosphate synthase
MINIFKKRKRTWEPDRLPCHVAIIMDGNGRWASKRALPRTAGHSVGAETFRRIATYCKDIGIEYLTVYAFSTENWRRPPEEIATIMALLEKYMHEALLKMERDKVKMKFFGDTSILSPKLKELISEAEAKSKTFDGVQVNICINYGGRKEILMAAERYAKSLVEGEIAGKGKCKDGELTEDAFSSLMYSAGIPDPDLVIRPSGEMRLSNFLLWQSAYSEFYFTDVLWPDFSERDLDDAIISYQNRQRRYGKIEN